MQTFRDFVYRLPLIRGILARLGTLERQVANLQTSVAVLQALIKGSKQISLPDTESEASCLFKKLLSDGEYAEKAWQDFYTQMCAHYEQFSDALGRHFNGEQLLHLLSLLLIPIVRNAFKDWNTKNSFFDIAERMGVHIIPVNYSSPIPISWELPDSLWQHRFNHSPALCFDGQAQLTLVGRLAKWAHEMSDTPKTQRFPTEFAWENPMFPPGDAVVYYSIIREFKPNIVMEVGAGYSILVASKAASRNGNTRIWAIDPYPPEFLKTDIPGLERLMIQPVQQIPLSVFESLGPNDILFIDGTHICKTGSDVNYIVLDVLPHLRSGVLVHFHDIYLPYEYPEVWVKKEKIFYSEQYLIGAFLMFNEAFEILLSNIYLGREYHEQLRAAFPLSPSVGGGSLWLRRK